MVISLLPAAPISIFVCMYRALRNERTPCCCSILSRQMQQHTAVYEQVYFHEMLRLALLLSMAGWSIEDQKTHMALRKGEVRRDEVSRYLYECPCNLTVPDNTRE